MSLLGYQDIMRLIDDGVIENADRNKVNAASLDLHLGNLFLVEDGVGVCSLLKPPPYVTRRDEIVLPPGGFCLAQTQERFHLPDDIAAEVKLRSSAARIGLNHALAGWCDPGWHGSVLTLEFHNTLKNHSIRLAAGDRVVQMVFFRLKKPVPHYASYRSRGRYNHDEVVKGAKV